VSQKSSSARISTASALSIIFSITSFIVVLPHLDQSKHNNWNPEALAHKLGQLLKKQTLLLLLARNRDLLQAL